MDRNIKAKVPAIRFAGLSAGWQQDTLSNMAVFAKGRGYSRGELCDTGTPIILYGRLYTNYETGISKVKTFVQEIAGSLISKGNEVIVPASGETAEDIARASAVLKSGVILGGDLNVIYPSEKLDSYFLSLTLSNGHTQKEVIRKAQGKSVVHVRNNDLQSLDVFYPLLNEQQKISSFFNQLDASLEQHQGKLDKLNNLKQAMLQKMFPQGDATAPEIRFEGFTDDWEKLSFKELVSVNSGRDYKHLGQGEVPVYGTGGYMLSVNEALSDKDSVGIGRKGTINKPYILRAPFWTVDTLFYATPQNGFFLKFVYCLFCKINWSEKDESTGVPSLSKVAIENTKTFVPGIAEQKKVGDYFHNLNELIDLERMQISKLKQVKESCLAKMFIVE